MIYRRFVKRLIDFSAASFALILFILPMLLAILLIRLSSPGAVVFIQTRAGLRGRAFSIYKLRTMTVDPDRSIRQTANEDPSVFPVGRVLRRFKIDELPQIFNILKGEMSLVGPRPCLEETRDSMPDWAKRRFEVRPGITGLAQVNGNIALPWEERWKYDVGYVERLGFLQDLRILLKTLRVVAIGEEKFRETP